jgi:hypothetical protein
MKILLAIILLLVQTGHTTLSLRGSSKSFAGSNSYYLHGLLPQEQAYYIQALKTDGAKVVRLWSELSP